MAKKRGIHVTNITDVTDHELSIAETNISEEQAIPHQDDDTPEDEANPILDYINSQHRQEDDMNHALQEYNIIYISFFRFYTPSVHQLGPYPPDLPCCTSKTSSTWFTC